MAEEELTSLYGHDSRGRQIVMTTPNQHVHKTLLDERGDLISREDPLGFSVSYTYDGMQRPLSYQNELSNSWRTEFDALGREVTQISPLGHTSEKSYDLAGRLISQTWPLGNRQVFSYDLLGNPESIQWFDETNSLESSVVLSHDSVGNLLWISSEGIEVFRSYDAMNRLTFIHIPALSRQIHLELDGDGRRLSRMLLNTNDQSFELTQYSYDLAGRLSEMRDGDLVTRFSYTPAGRLSQIVYPNGIIKDSAYDLAGRLSSIRYSLSSQTLQTQAFTYDKDSRRIAETTEDGTTTYTYDAKGQLLSVNYPSGQWEQFSYDAAGNKTMIQSDQKSQHLSFDSENRLQTSGEYQNTWNENGWLVSRTHMVTQTETHFEYSARGKLTSVRYSDGTSSTFSYYPESDLRLEATHPQNPPTRYLFDGESEFVTLSSTNQALTTISSLPNSYDDRLFQRTSDGDLSTWLTDHLNSVRKTVTDTSDINSAKTFAYYAFGSLRSGDPINNLAFGYTGRSLDLPANLYYYRGRMLDTCSGTFTQVDPMRDGNNWTAYVGGDPISYNDPSGYVAAAAAAAGGIGKLCVDAVLAVLLTQKIKDASGQCGGKEKPKPTPKGCKSKEKAKTKDNRDECKKLADDEHKLLVQWAIKRERCQRLGNGATRGVETIREILKCLHEVNGAYSRLHDIIKNQKSEAGC